ncbi:MAG: hypothetical protein ACQESN_01235 [Thermotogota bacterium]
MKNFLYSNSFEKQINIFIEDNISKIILEKYEDYFSSLIVLESNLRDIFKTKNAKFIRSGKEAKSLDKFLDLSNTINKNKISNLINFGGKELLNLCGYTYNSVNFNKKLLIFIPTTLESMIIPNINGDFGLNMNFEENFLKVQGFPDFVYIDPILLKENSKLRTKKSFLYAYFLGYLSNSKYSKLCVNYIKKNENLDFYNFVINGLSISLSIFSSFGNFPGNRLKYKLFNKTYMLKNNSVDIDAVIFLFISYLSYLNGQNIENVLNFLNFINYIGIDIKKIINNFDLSTDNRSFKEIILTKNHLKEILISTQELKNYLDEFLIFIRGELI